MARPSPCIGFAIFTNHRSIHGGTTRELLGRLAPSSQVPPLGFRPPPYWFPPPHRFPRTRAAQLRRRARLISPRNLCKHSARGGGPKGRSERSEPSAGCRGLPAKRNSSGRQKQAPRKPGRATLHEVPCWHECCTWNDCRHCRAYCGTIGDGTCSICAGIIRTFDVNRANTSVRR